MFNYHNLNDVEFESLCQDIMERMLSVKLRCFSKGRDGGIDLTDNVSNHNVIVQVKHYIRSKFANLRTSLHGEVEKVEGWSPQKYYICCGMELTHPNIKEIYDLFSGYMESDQNIITLFEIDEFLQKPENADIVRKHYKLWLYASGILNQILNQDIFIDCEALLNNISDESKYFVQTKVYEQCLDCLDKHRMIMITGQPGVGKTITSKMLVLYYAAQGYAVRYTTNGDISDIKRSLSQDKEAKEVVLLDDCLGQHYFSMKETQENELTSLAQYIRIHENKKLILNSRITILNEARERCEALDLFLKEKKIDQRTINMDTITRIEKAKILYNHLISKSVPREYYEDIKVNKNYLSIVDHTNYTPRIIEHVTLSSNYLKIPTSKFASYILYSLNNPNDIWKNEYYHRIQVEDRVFLTTLYSLTDTTIDYDVLKKCFNKRLMQKRDIDYTINNFEAVLARLNHSMVKVADNRGKMQVGVINPSVNDFLKQVFFANELEVSEIRKAAINYLQIQRCYSKDDIAILMVEMFRNGSILDIDFNDKFEKDYFITSYLCAHCIFDLRYSETISQYLQYSYGLLLVQEGFLPHDFVLDRLLSDAFSDYYNIADMFDEQLIENLLTDSDLENLVSAINRLITYVNNAGMEHKDCFVVVCKRILQEAVSNYIENIDISDYCDGYDMTEVMSQNLVYHEYGADVNEDAIVKIITDNIVSDVQDNITDMISTLYVSEIGIIRIPSIYVDESEVVGYIHSYLDPDVDDDDFRENGAGFSESYEDEICLIFER